MRTQGVITLRVVGYVAALATLVASGVTHGFWSGRWTKSRALEERVAALRNVPPKVGDWVGEDSQLDRRSVEMGEISGHLMRRYKNPRDGAEVTVLIVCGRPGPIAVHTPEVCYGGNGYAQLAPRQKYAVGSGGTPAGDVWSVDMGKGGPLGDQRLRVIYTWTTDGKWHASQAPRVDFAGAPALYKLYFVAPGDKGASPLGGPQGRFLTQLLPVLQKSLFPSPTG